MNNLTSKKEQLFYDFFKLYPVEKNQKNIPSDYFKLGYVIPFDNKDVSIKILNEYVCFIDKILDDLSQVDPKNQFGIYNEILNRRFLSWDEFQLIFQQFAKKITKDNWYEFDSLSLKYIERNHCGRDWFIRMYKPEKKYYLKFFNKTKLKIKKFFPESLPVYFHEKERRKHTFVCGGTGSGKSELLKYIIAGYLLKKTPTCSIVIIDPHGDLALETTKFKINSDRSESLIYIDPALSNDISPSINPFELKDKSKQNVDTHAQELTKTFEELLKDVSLTLQMQTLLIPCISVLLSHDDFSIMDLQRFMNDDSNSDLVNLGKNSKNPSHANFFEAAFFNKTYSVTKQSIYTKIQSLINNSYFYNFITKPSTIDLEKELNSKKLIIFNLSKGKLSGQISEAIGKMIVAQIKSIALKRANINIEKRVPVHLFIDEFQNYISPSIESILTEARKYKLYLTAACQILGQNTGQQLKEVILSCTNIKITGKNSTKTLGAMSKECGMDIQKMQNLNIGEFYIKCGMNRPPFKFYVPDRFIGDKFSMTSNEWKKILTEQKNKYYSHIDDCCRRKEIHENKKAFKNKKEPDENNIFNGKPRFKL
jgi:hypothetical protein